MSEVRGADLVELLTNGEDITGHCLLCHKKIGTWSNYTLLANVIFAWEEHVRGERVVKPGSH